MRSLLLLALLTACGTSCPEDKIPANGPIRRGVFVEDGDYLQVASAVGGNLVREDCDANLRLLGPDLMTERTVDLGYKYERETSVLALARATDRGIAAVTWELDYASNDDELTRLRLVSIAPAGNVAWTRLLSDTETSAPPDPHVAIGWDQIFVLDWGGVLTAYSRTTGDIAWQKGVSATATRRSDLAVKDDGDVVVAGLGVGGVAAYTPAGEMRWHMTPDMFGMDEVDHIAADINGSLAVVGESGERPFATRRVALVAPDGALMWSRDVGMPYADEVTSIATDGVRVVAAGEFVGQLSFDPSKRNDHDTDGFIVSIGANGVDAVQVAGGAGTQKADVVTIYGGQSAIVRVQNFDEAGAEMRIGDVAITGVGLALVDFAHL